MAKKAKKAKIEKEAGITKDDSLKEVLNGITDLTNGMCGVVASVKELTGRVNQLEEDKVPKAEDVIVNESAPVLGEGLNGNVIADPTPEATKEEDAIPIPSEYRMIVNEMLNRSFGIEVTASPSIPSFEFTIIVPETYSNILKDDRDIITEDRRTKVITYAENVDGVKAWVTKIYNNFNEETKSRITQDRITNVN